MATLWAAVLATALAVAASQPASWLPAIAAHDLLYTTDDSKVATSSMPMIGNGFVATQISSCEVFVSNIFNGYLTDAPSHRAVVPATNSIAAPGTISDAGLNVREATYYRRSYVDPATAGCTVNSTSTCSNAGSRIWVEQRWYAHRTVASLMVMEVEVLTSDAAARSDADASVIAPETHKHVRGSASGPYAMLKLSPSSCPGSSDIKFAALPVPQGAPYNIINGSTLVAETNTSSLQAVAVLTSAWPANNMLQVSGPGVTYAFMTVIRTSYETAPSELAAAVESDYALAVQMANNGTLHSSHVTEWQETVWTSGLETDRPDVAAVMNTSIYSLMSSIRTDRIGGISPGGLTAGYNGHTFWDQETWMWPSINALHPENAAALLEYRLQRLDGARAKAQSYTPPYAGAMFPWESALTGQETCPSWAPEGSREIHINGDIGMAVWQYWRSIQDNGNQWLETVGYPILSGIADFFMSKMAIDNPTAIIPGWPTASPLPNGGALPLSICDVIPPDEYHDHVNNSVFTNVGARLTLTYAAQAAQLLGQPPSVYSAWLNASARIVIPFNASWPGLNGGLHPEYEGYVHDTVKQADVILLGFPVDLTAFGNNTAQVRANDLAYYATVTDPNGPAMTWGMFAAGYIELGNLATASSFFNRSFANAQQPFLVWDETPQGGTPNFLTGAGGFLQGPLFGYTQLRLKDTAATLNPVLFEGATVSALRGWSYRGQRLNIQYTASTVTIAAQAPSTEEQLMPKPTHRYAPMGSEAVVPGLEETQTSIPVHDLSTRSQRGQVTVNGYRVRAANLQVIDASGKAYPITPAGITLPLQALTIVAA